MITYVDKDLEVFLFFYPFFPSRLFFFAYYSKHFRHLRVVLLEKNLILNIAHFQRFSCSSYTFFAIEECHGQNYNSEENTYT